MKISGKTSATLLVPAEVFSYFRKRVLRLGSSAAYFRFLLRKYSIRKVSVHCKFNKRYQEKYLDLRKYNFRPEYSDWVKIGLISEYSRISRTAIFVMMVMWDMEGEEEAGDHTTKTLIFNISYTKSFNVNSVKIILRP